MRKLVAIGIVGVLSTAAGACGGDDDDSASGGDFCERARSFQEEFGSDESASDEEGLAAFNELADIAPDEIKDEMEQLADFSERAIEAGDDPDEQAKLIEEAAKLEEPGQKVTEYFQEECGIDLDGSDTTQETVGG
jgi:hypothetical protein